VKNRYKTISVLLFCISILLVLIMVAHSLIDYQNYLQHPEYSSPFSVNLIFKSIIYGIPIIVGFVLSVMIKRKSVEQ